MNHHPSPSRLGRGSKAVLATACAITTLLTAPVPPAAAAGRHVTDVPADLRDGRVLILRPHRIDLAVDGVVQRTVPHLGPLDLARLPELLADQRYARRMSPTSVRLSATLAQRPGTSIVTSARGVREVELDAGVGLYGTRARLKLTGVRLTSVSDAAPGLLRYGAGSVVTLQGTEIVGLGKGGRESFPAVRVTRAAVEATDLALIGGGPGIVADRTTSASLTKVRVHGCGGDGIVIKGGRLVRLAGLAAQGCRGDGIRVTGPISLPGFRGPVSVANNAGSGLLLDAVRDLHLADVTSTGNLGSGIRLKGVKNADLERVSSTRDLVGVAMEDSANVNMSQIQAQAVGVGVSAKRTTKLKINAIVVSSAGIAGLSLSARDALLASSSVDAAPQGLIIQSGAQNITVRDTALTGTQVAVRVARSTAGVTLSDDALSSPSGTAVQASGEDVSLVGCSVTGRIGVVIRGRDNMLRMTSTTVDADGVALDLGRWSGAASVTGSRFTGADPVVAVRGDSLTMTGTTVEGRRSAAFVLTRLVARNVSLTADSVGMRATKSAQVTVTDSRIRAGSVGVSAAKSAAVTLDQTQVSAPRPSSGPVTFLGRNRWSHLPLRWIALAVLLVMTVAIMLEIIRKLREHSHVEHAGVPAHVLNWR